MRAAVISVAPLLHQIQRDLGLSHAAAGLLTTLPVLCFGLCAGIGPVLARRRSFELILFGTIVLLTGAILIRLIPTPGALFGGTLLIGVAISVGNVMVPALIKRDFAAKSGLVVSAYVVALSLPTAIAAGATVPIEQHFGLDWRGALAVWAIPAALAIVVWAPQLRVAQRVTDGTNALRMRALLRDPVAWYVTLFMGLQSLIFYTAAAWIPTFLFERGASPTTAGWLFAATNVSSVFAVLGFPVVAARLRDAAPLVWLTLLPYTASLLALTLLPYAFWLTFGLMLVLGFAQGGTISLAISFIVQRAPDARVAAPLSGLAQGVGYALAAFGPSTFGALRDTTHGWLVPFAMLVVLTLPLLAAGLAAGRPRFVGAAVPA